MKDKTCVFIVFSLILVAIIIFIVWHMDNNNNGVFNLGYVADLIPYNNNVQQLDPSALITDPNICPQGVTIGGTFSVQQVPTVLTISIDAGKVTHATRELELTGTSGNFVFPFEIFPDSTYDIEMKDDFGDVCVIQNGSGVVSGSTNIGNVDVKCTPVALLTPIISNLVQTYSNDGKVYTAQLVVNNICCSKKHLGYVKVYRNDILVNTIENILQPDKRWIYADTIPLDELSFTTPVKYHVEQGVAKTVSKKSNVSTIQMFKNFLPLPKIKKVNNSYHITHVCKGFNLQKGQTMLIKCKTTHNQSMTVTALPSIHATILPNAMIQYSMTVKPEKESTELSIAYINPFSKIISNEQIIKLP